MNSFSILKPLSSLKIIISLENNTNSDLNDIKYKILFSFYLFNKNRSNTSDLNSLIKDKIGKENQTTEVIINITNKVLNIDEKYIQKYEKFKNELNDINKKIGSVIGISNKKNINKNKFIFAIILFLIIIICGFLFELKLSILYNRLFKNKKIENTYSIKDINNEEDKYFEEIQFLSVNEMDGCKDLYYDNLKKINQINNFNIYNAVKQNKESKKFNYNKKKEETKNNTILNNINTKKENKKHNSLIEYILIPILFSILIFI